MHTALKKSVYSSLVPIRFLFFQIDCRSMSSIEIWLFLFTFLFCSIYLEIQYIVFVSSVPCAVTERDFMIYINRFHLYHYPIPYSSSSFLLLSSSFYCIFIFCCLETPNSIYTCIWNSKHTTNFKINIYKEIQATATAMAKHNNETKQHQQRIFIHFFWFPHSP